MATNTVVLEGRLTKKPEVKVTSSGKKVCSFTLANDKRGKEDTNFIDCTAWEGRGETIAKYFDKGSQIVITGHLDQQVWEKDGQKRSKLEVVVDDFSFIGKREGKNEETPSSDDHIDISEIPF